MTTLATGSSVTVTIGDAGSITIATNGGMASIAITPTVGAAYSEGIGPLPSRKTWKLAEGGSATISNQTASLDYDWERGGGIDPALSALVSGAGTGVSGVSYDGSGRCTGFTLGTVAYTISGWGGSTVTVAGSDGSSREISLDGSGRISGAV